MNKRIYIIFFILLGFVLNIFFYIFSNNYRYFLQSLKSDGKIKISDEFRVNTNKLVVESKNNKKDESIFSGLKRDFNEELENKNNKKENKNSKKNIIKEYNKDNEIKNKGEKYKPKVIFSSKKEKIKLTKVDEKILKSFKKYKLKEVELHPRLFDLTSEYPDKYFEYYSKDITLYFFGNKPYNEIKDIFGVLIYELPISIKEINNFGQKSFYINLNDLFNDDYVRIVIKKSNRTFGLKIKKELYNKIKNNLVLTFKK